MLISSATRGRTKANSNQRYQTILPHENSQGTALAESGPPPMRYSNLPRAIRLKTSHNEALESDGHSAPLLNRDIQYGNKQYPNQYNSYGKSQLPRKIQTLDLSPKPNKNDSSAIALRRFKTQSQGKPLLPQNKASPPGTLQITPSISTSASSPVSQITNPVGKRLASPVSIQVSPPPAVSPISPHGRKTADSDAHILSHRISSTAEPSRRNISPGSPTGAKRNFWPGTLPLSHRCVSPDTSPGNQRTFWPGSLPVPKNNPSPGHSPGRHKGHSPRRSPGFDRIDLEANCLSIQRNASPRISPRFPVPESTPMPHNNNKSGLSPLPYKPNSVGIHIASRSESPLPAILNLSRNTSPRTSVNSKVPDAHDRIEKIPKEKHDCTKLGCEIMTINVCGQIYEARIYKFEHEHPTTLLGDPDKRRKYYDHQRDEYFFDRHRPSFEAIFAYFMYGKLVRPQNIPDEIFIDECRFYDIEPDIIDAYKVKEGYVEDDFVMPEHPLKRKIWCLFECPETSVLAYAIALSSILTTVISIVIFCIETLPRFHEPHCEEGEMPNFTDPFFLIESVCTTWFTIEVVVRFIVCPNKLTFVKDIKNIIDMVSIIPHYITVGDMVITMHCDHENVGSLELLRVVRLIRIFKLTKHSAGLQAGVRTFKASIKGLGLFFITIVFCTFLFSSAMYNVERGHKNSKISSIPDGFWWAIITLCTVGYGDVHPVSVMGKIVGAVCAIAGVLTLALPVPIITENFNKFYSHAHRKIRS